jgi:hypothetical protein
VEHSLAEPGAGGNSPLEGGRGGGLVVVLLAERARSEGARSTRAIEDQPDRPLRGVERRKARDEKTWKGHPRWSCAPGTRALRRASFDSRTLTNMGALPRGEKRASLEGQFKTHRRSESAIAW